MSPYNPKEDKWLWSRLQWLKDNQPQRLRELAREPAKLLVVLDQAVQSARQAWLRAEKAGADKEQAKEIGLSVLCPEQENPPEPLELPIADKEWEAIKEAVKSAPDET